MKTASLFEYLTVDLEPMSPIELRAVSNNICPVCRVKKSLEEAHRGNGLIWKQCVKCRRVFVTEAENYIF